MKIYSSEEDVENYIMGIENDWYDKLASHIPSAVFKTRVRDESIGGSNPFRWKEVSTWDLFAGKKVLLFALPGAFTPTCDTYQLPHFEELADRFFEDLHFDDIYCLSVNDAFVMNKWAESQNLHNVKVLPDGNADFTKAINMEVAKENLGFGVRSWRYAIVVENGKITHWFIEEGKEPNCEEDPYEYTDPNFILSSLL